jgi:hypothetical protein
MVWDKRMVGACGMVLVGVGHLEVTVGRMKVGLNGWRALILTLGAT